MYNLNNILLLNMLLFYNGLVFIFDTSTYTSGITPVLLHHFPFLNFISFAEGRVLLELCVYVHNASYELEKCIL